MYERGHVYTKKYFRNSVSRDRCFHLVHLISDSAEVPHHSKKDLYKDLYIHLIFFTLSPSLNLT